MSEVWFRNPLTYIRECAQLLVPNIVWDRGFLHKNRVDAQKHLDVHMPSAVDYRILLVGDQGTAELRRGHPKTAPYAVYPTWEYGTQSMGDLEDMIAHQRVDTRAVNRRPPDERAVVGQEHRVVIIRAPNASTLPGRAFLSTLRELQFEYPKCIIHYHGTYSFRVAFGLGFAAADIDPVAHSSKGRVVIGSGRYFPWEEVINYPAWMSLGGFHYQDLSVARNRTMFNMRSAMWAADNFDSTDVFRSRPSDTPIDHTALVAVPVTVAKHAHGKPQPGDKVLCAQCSLAPSCRYQRDGGVCAIPDSETSGLARYFKTRDSETIIDGLGRLMEVQFARAERGLEAEKVQPELDPEVTRILKTLFEEGVKLAKLVNPNLAGGTKVGVFINGSSGSVQVGSGGETANALVAATIAELESQGIDRKDIDAEMVAQYLANRNRAAIEASAT